MGRKDPCYHPNCTFPSRNAPLLCTVTQCCAAVFRSCSKAAQVTLTQATLTFSPSLCRLPLLFFSSQQIDLCIQLLFYYNPIIFSVNGILQ